MLAGTSDVFRIEHATGLDSHWPGSTLAWTHTSLDPHWPGLTLVCSDPHWAWIHTGLDSHWPGPTLAWTHTDLDPYWPGSTLAWIHTGLDPHWPGPGAGAHAPAVMDPGSAPVMKACRHFKKSTFQNFFGVWIK